MKNKLFGILITLTFFVTIPVHAKEVNDFYTDANENVKFEDTVTGDSAIAGNIVDILGNIDGIGFIAGKTVNINGNLEYAFLGGQVVTVNGKIQKNLYTAGQTINITKDATIERDIFIVGQNVNLNGNLNRNLRVGADKVIIEEGTNIKGNITINTNSLIIKDNVKINGTLKYNNDAQKDINKNASIGKTVTYNGTSSDDDNFDISDTIMSIINMIVLFLVISMIIPKAVTKTTEIYSKNHNYLKSFGIGLLILICTPIIAILLLVSSIGVSLGLIIAALYAICLYLSSIAAGFVLGYLVFNKLLKVNINNYLSGIIGIIALKFLVLIPYVGFIVSLLGITIGLATICYLLKCDEKKPNKNDKVIEAETKVKKAKTK